jgi:hypothetical protein
MAHRKRPKIFLLHLIHSSETHKHFLTQTRLLMRLPFIFYLWSSINLCKVALTIALLSSSTLWVRNTKWIWHRKTKRLNLGNFSAAHLGWITNERQLFTALTLNHYRHFYCQRDCKDWNLRLDYISYHFHQTNYSFELWWGVEGVEEELWKFGGV